MLYLALGLAGMGTVLLVQVLALLLDLRLGEPRRWHPLVGFGRWSGWLQQRLNRGAQQRRRWAGVLAWVLAVCPPVLILSAALWLAWQIAPWLFWLLNLLMLYLTLGLRSLGEHARWVAEPLAQGDLDKAREKVAWLVSRNTEQMDAEHLSKACIESVLENGNDAVYGALFWFLLAGAPGALAYRLVNTLDASWGYRSDQYRAFGWWAARADDWLGYVPARLCALCYSLSGNCSRALADWHQADSWRRSDGRGFASPNAGIVMASGAGALNLGLGGVAFYQGVQVFKPHLGSGRPPGAEDIKAAVALLSRSLMLFLGLQLVAWLLWWLLWI